MALGTLGAAAVECCRRGWAVLPLAARGKVPAIRGGCRAAVADAAQARAWWDVNPSHNLGIATGAVSGGLFAIDLDVDDDAGEDGVGTLRAWEREHGELPLTVTAVTGRGGMHLFYRSDSPVGCSVNKELGVDIRGEGGFVVAAPSVHPNGRAYCWENDPCDFEVAEADSLVMDFLKFAGARRGLGGSAGGGFCGERFRLPDRIGAGGRNDTLFKYASSLQAQGRDDVEIALLVERANAERCRPPLPDSEIRVLVESATGRYEKGEVRAGAAGDGDGFSGRGRRFRKADRNGNATGPVLHNVVAKELIEAHRACYVDGAPAIWAGGRYASGWDEVNRATVGLIDDCKMADQKEIRHYVHLKAPRVEASPPWLIAFSNGVLDLRTGGFRPMDSSMVITNVIPHDWDPDARCDVVDRFLDNVSCGDATVRANLEEVVGMCMYRSNDFGQCPVLIGSGSNGKSTYISALRNVLGPENVSSLDINVVGKPFQAGRLLGKLANLGDDISNERLSGDVLAVFKKVVTGEWIYTDVKNSDGFEFKPYCTLVFSCNEFPSLGDSSEGMLRRLFPIPFDARFSRADADYDPRLWDKLRDERAAAYLARLGVEGLRRVMAGNGLTPNGRSDDVVDEVRCENDSVLQWLAEGDLPDGWLDGRVIADAYERYSSWCASSNLRPFGRTRFTRKVNAAGGYTSAVEKREYVGGSRAVRVFASLG